MRYSFVFILLLFTSACGKTGPLFLPDQAQPQAERPLTDQPQPAPRTKEQAD